MVIVQWISQRDTSIKVGDIKKQIYFLYSILLWKIQQMSNVLIVKDADIVINARTANSAINVITLVIKDIVLKT